MTPKRKKWKKDKKKIKNIEKINKPDVIDSFFVSIIFLRAVQFERKHFFPIAASPFFSHCLHFHLSPVTDTHIHMSIYYIHILYTYVLICTLNKPGAISVDIFFSQKSATNKKKMLMKREMNTFEFGIMCIQSSSRLIDDWPTLRLNKDLPFRSLNATIEKNSNEKTCEKKKKRTSPDIHSIEESSLLSCGVHYFSVSTMCAQTLQWCRASSKLID